jgi:hypothetical protein
MDVKKLKMLWIALLIAAAGALGGCASDYSDLESGHEGHGSQHRGSGGSCH